MLFLTVQKTDYAWSHPLPVTSSSFFIFTPILLKISFWSFHLCIPGRGTDKHSTIINTCAVETGRRSESGRVTEKWRTSWAEEAVSLRIKTCYFSELTGHFSALSHPAASTSSLSPLIVLNPGEFSKGKKRLFVDYLAFCIETRIGRKANDFYLTMIKEQWHSYEREPGEEKKYLFLFWVFILSF